MEDVPKPESTKDILEILRQRREMINRVRRDLQRVQELQQEFAASTEKRAEKPPAKP